MKNGLAVICCPHNLHQFIWYFCNRGKEFEWDALCVPNDAQENMHSDCEKTGIFSHVFIDDCAFQFLPLGEQLHQFMLMLWHFVTGRRKTYCRRLLKKRVEWEKYDEVVVLDALGVVYGACVALGEEKRVVILEDGASDYLVRSKWIEKSKLASFREWKGFILSHMGYCCPGWYYFKPEKNCIKYSSFPEKMKNHNYKEIHRLYEQKGTDRELFDKIIRDLYPQLNDIDFESIQAVLFTEPFEDYIYDSKEYIDKVMQYVSSKYQKILLKKHPRECSVYEFAEPLQVQEISKEIPAEILLPFLSGKEVILFECCTLIMHLKSYGLHCTVLHFSELQKDSIKANKMMVAPSYEMVDNFAKRFNEDNYEIQVL